MRFRSFILLITVLFVAGCNFKDPKIKDKKYVINYKLNHKYKLPFGMKIFSFINLNEARFFKVDDTLRVGLDVFPFVDKFIYTLPKQEKWKELKCFVKTSTGIKNYLFFNRDSVFMITNNNKRYSYDSSFVVTDLSFTHYKIFEVPDTILVTKKSIPHLYTDSFSTDDIKGKKFISTSLILPDYNKIAYVYWLDSVDNYNIPKGAVFDYKTGELNYLKFNIPGYTKDTKIPIGLFHVRLFELKNQDRFLIYFYFTPYAYLYDLSDGKIIDTLKFASDYFDDIATSYEGMDEYKYYGNWYGPFEYLNGKLVRRFTYNPDHYRKYPVIYSIYNPETFEKVGDFFYNSPKGDEDFMRTFYGNEAWFTNIDIEKDSIYINEYEINLSEISDKQFSYKVDSVLKEGFDQLKNEGVCEVGGALTQAKNGGWKYLSENLLKGEKNYVAVILSMFGCQSCNETIFENVMFNQGLYFSDKLKKKFYLIYVGAGMKKDYLKKDLKKRHILLHKNILIDTTNLYPVKYNKSIAQNPRLVLVDSLGNLELDSVYETGDQDNMIKYMLGELLGEQ